MPDMSGLAGLDGRAPGILEILRAYCRIPSITNTPGETRVNGFFRRQLADLPYFLKHPDHLGVWDIEKDRLGRQVSWAMIRGGNEKTVVLIHHSDVVVTDNFGPYQDLALDPERLDAAFRSDPGLLDEEARADLASGQWLFGRGTADMKGGGAIQLALFRIYGRYGPEKLRELPTLVLLALPDEENLSAGMRSALGLLNQLKADHGLEYVLMINSEPHQRLTPEKGVVSQGSIAKLNLFVYARGVMAHAGKALEGINPTGLMGRIVARTDLSRDFVDHIPGESSIPPTWVYLRDLKPQYDISFPEAVFGMFNVLNFHTGPEAMLDQLVRICREELGEYLAGINRKRQEFARQTGRNWPGFDWPARVVPYGDLKAMTPALGKKLPLEEELGARLSGLYPGEPVIVAGLCPPYYPGVTNPDQERLHTLVRTFTRDCFGQDYDNRAYFTGISDLSYAMSAGDPRTLGAVMAHMAGEDYEIPFGLIENISMNCINIGPWGKDFHRPSERVFKQDLLQRTPMLIDHVIRTC